MYAVIFFSFEPTTGDKTFLGIDSFHKEFCDAEFRLEEILEKYNSPELAVEILTSTSIDFFKDNGCF